MPERLPRAPSEAGERGEALADRLGGDIELGHLDPAAERVARRMCSRRSTAYMCPLTDAWSRDVGQRSQPGEVA
jgi:hypothetical protein